MSSDPDTKLDAATLSAEIKARIATEFVAELTEVRCNDTSQLFNATFVLVRRLWRMRASRDASESPESGWRHPKRYAATLQASSYA